MQAVLNAGSQSSEDGDSPTPVSAMGASSRVENDDKGPTGNLKRTVQDFAQFEATSEQFGRWNCMEVLKRQRRSQEKLSCIAKQVYRAPGTCQWQLVGPGTQQAMTWAEVLEGLRDDDDVQGVQAELTRALEDMAREFSGFYMECVPLEAASSSSTVFEFTVIDAPGLANRASNPADFAAHFARLDWDCQVTSFENLGRDALLVVPTPPSEPEHHTHYGHPAALFRGKSEGQVPMRKLTAIWQELGRTIMEKLNTADTIWVNTDGRSVPWLHFRLDRRPKYYKWQPYTKRRFS